MAFVSQHLSVTKKTPVCKTRIGSGRLPCFSRIPFTSKPFFRQWYIHTVDIARILCISYAVARQVMHDLRSSVGKTKHDVITVDEFCAFTGISKGYVRMHLAARVMEHELLRTVNGEWAMVNRVTRES